MKRRISKRTKTISRFLGMSFLFLSLVANQQMVAFAQELASDSANIASSSAEPSNSSSSESAILQPSVEQNLQQILGQGSTASGSFTPTPIISPTVSLSAPSATLRLPEKVLALFKQTFRVGETVNLTVQNASPSDVVVQVLDPQGEQLSGSYIEKTGLDSNTSVSINTPDHFRPGEYSVQISNSKGVVSTQNFIWGVLAINTNKSEYVSGDTAHIAMTVLNSRGTQVCDASVDLRITSPTGTVSDLSTKNGQITVSDTCSEKGLIVTPDYAATYTTGDSGIYKMTLSATTIDDGKYSISDSFLVTNSVPFDVERASATRIYPPVTYPMSFTILANQDFSGTIVEAVPAGFVLSKGGGGIDFSGEKSMVDPVSGENKQFLYWDVSLKKGNTVYLSYTYQTPPESPEFYEVGPLTFYDQTGNMVFQEARTWQLAIDAASTIFMSDGTDATYDFKFWSSTTGTVNSDYTIYKTGKRSIQADSTSGNTASYVTENSVLADAGRRITTWVRFSQFPTADTAFLGDGTGTRWNLRISSTGVLKLYNNTTQIGSNGSTLATGTWYRIGVSYTITSGSVDSFTEYLNGTSDITVTNATVTTGTANLSLGWVAAPGASKVLNVDNIYVDNGTDVADPGDVRVTAKLPNANGTNNFNTAIGNSPSSRYQNVDERPLSETNGWEQSTVGTTNFGYATIGGSTYSVSANHKVFTKFTTGSAVGTVQSASAYLNRTGTGSGYSAAFGIYTDSSGAPGTLVANSQITLSTNLTRNSAQWYTATYGTAPTLSASTTYWIGVEFANASTVNYDTGSSNQSYDQTQTYGTLTSPWGTPGTALSDQMSYYVTYIQPTYETYGIQSVSTGDEDITGKTIVAHQAWVWAKVGTANSAWILDNGTEVSKSLTTSSAMYTDIVDSATYPSNASAVGMRASETGTTSTYLYETGMDIAFLVPPTPQLTQELYRWRNDNGTESGATWKRAEDTSANDPIGTTVRLRIEFSNLGTQTASGTTYRLEYGVLSSTCTAVGTWTQVPTTATIEAFQMASSSYVSDATATTAQLTAGNTTFVAGQVKTSGSDTTGISLTSVQYTEIEYSITPTSNASNGTYYCFRLTNAGSTTYFAYEEATYGLLIVGTPTMVQKHYRWRNDDGNESAKTGLTLYYSPTGEGFANAFAINAGCTAGNNWDCVNDNTSNAGTAASAPTSDQSTSALQLANGTDYYTLADNAIPDNSTVTQLDISVWGIKTSNPGSNIQIGYCTTCNGSNNFLGTSQGVTAASYTEYTQQFTGLSLTSTDLNNMQLVVSGNGTRSAISTVYVKVTYNTTGATWAASEDSNSFTASRSTNYRLRFEIANEGNIPSNRNFLLEYAVRTGTACGDDEIFATVPITATTEPFEMTTSYNFTNSDATTAQLTSDGTFSSGLMIQDPSNSSGTTSLTNGYYTEYEFNLAANSNASGWYCFRLTDNGTALDSYSLYPQIYISPAMNLLMRHGKWFNSLGAKQPFTF